MSGTWSSLLNKFLSKKRKKGRNTSSVVLLSAFGGSLFHHGIILSVKSFFPGWTNFCVSVFSPSLSLQSSFENSLNDHFYFASPLQPSSSADQGSDWHSLRGAPEVTSWACLAAFVTLLYWGWILWRQRFKDTPAYMVPHWASCTWTSTHHTCNPAAHLQYIFWGKGCPLFLHAPEMLTWQAQASFFAVLGFYWSHQNLGIVKCHSV